MPPSASSARWCLRQVRLGRGEPVALEIAADTERRRFLVRTSSIAAQRRVASQLGTAYPQAGLRQFDAASFPNGDPTQLGPDEQVDVTILRLRAGEHLPLRTLEDRDLDSIAASTQADPLLGILGALTDLPPAWRALAQLVVLGQLRLGPRLPAHGPGTTPRP